MQDHTDTPTKSPYLGEPGTRPPALGGTLCDNETEGPQCHCHGAHGSPSPVLPPEDPVLVDLLSENPPPYQAPPPAGPSPPASAEARSPDTTSPAANEGTSTPSPFASRLRLRRDPREGETGEWKAQVFPLRTVGGPGNQVQYWPFSASDLYNLKIH